MAFENWLIARLALPSSKSKLAILNNSAGLFSRMDVCESNAMAPFLSLFPIFSETETRTFFSSSLILGSILASIPYEAVKALINDSDFHIGSIGKEDAETILIPIIKISIMYLEII